MTIRTISKELQEIAKNELNEAPERIEKDINHIKEWLIKQPYLKSRSDDQFILTFLRCCKFSLQRTKEKIENYYIIRSNFPQYFTNRDPSELSIQKLLKLGAFLPLIRKEYEGPVILMMRLRDTKANELPIQCFMKCVFMLVDIILHEEDTLLAGFNLVFDLDNMDYQYIFQATPYILKSIVDLAQSAYPLRIKQWHYINAPSFAVKLVNMLKLMLNKKIASRLFCYAKEDDYKMSERFPKVIVPKEYGGDGPTIQDYIDVWKKRVEDKAKWFYEDEEYGVDEQQLKVHLKQCNFDMHSSFRKLEID